MLWRIIAFVAATVALICVSRASLRRPRSHGFYRFFAWEVIVALFLLNVGRWFADPFSWHQIIAWCLLIICCVPVAWGTIMLRRHGRPMAQRHGDNSLLAFEKTSQLVTGGIYRYIRHPLYSSLLLLAWAIFFKAPSILGGSLALIATALLVLTALADEAECISFFGSDYRDYMRSTRRFIPFVI